MKNKKETLEERVKRIHKKILKENTTKNEVGICIKQLSPIIDKLAKINKESDDEYWDVYANADSSQLVKALKMLYSAYSVGNPYDDIYKEVFK